MKKILYIFVLLFLFIFTSCDKKVTTYEVIFMDNGNIVSVQQIEKGHDADISILDKTGYTITGYSTDYTNIQSDLEINIIYEKDPIKVCFYNGDILLKEEIVEEGASATPPEINKEEGHIYRWDASFEDVTESIDVHLIDTIKQLEVYFFDSHNDILDKSLVEYGSAATAPDPEEVENFKFIGWSEDFSCVKENLFIYPNYKQYQGSITYYFGDKVLNLAPATYICGEEIELPVLEAEGYEFNGWTLDEISYTYYDKTTSKMNSDLSFYADVTETTCHKELVLPSADDHFLELKKVANSTTSANCYVYQPVLPTTARYTSVMEYNWTTSDNSIAIVSQYSSISCVSNGYCVLTGTSKTDSTYSINCVIKISSVGPQISSVEEANEFVMYQVTFKGKDGETIAVKQVRSGMSTIYPTPLTYEGYMFNGWDKVCYNITEDTTITATYVQGTDKYTGKKFAVIGDSISTYRPNIPDGFSCFYPYATADIFDINQMWWMQTINALGGQLFVDNAYSGSCVGGVATSATKLMSRCEYTCLQGETPDVIMIYMTSNDIASSMDVDVIKASYKQMLENLKELCPDAEIILCNIPLCGLCKDPKRTNVNAAIEELANEYQYTLVKLSNIDITGDLTDSAHPVFSGHTKIANEIVKTIR